MSFPVKDPFDAFPDFALGGGEMGERIRAYNWSKTSLGPLETWPKSLQTCIRIMLTSRQPIWIGWGKDLIKFYNDPYKAIVGGKHPWALGQPASVVWRDIWKDIQPMLRVVMENDEGTYVEEQLLIMERNGYPEETYYTFSYTPIPGEDGGTAGMICANTEDTDRILSQRQLQTLTRLGKTLTDTKTNEEIFQKTIEVFQENPKDFPCALFYELSDSTARLVAATLTEADGIAEIDLKGEQGYAASIRNAIRSNEITMLDSPGAFLRGATEYPWSRKPDKAIVLPVGRSGTREAVGVLVIGLNPYRLLDEKYKGFFNLISDQISTSLASAYAFEEERKRIQALAEIDQAKTTFFSNISHEFRTPLTLMLGPLEDALNDRRIGPNRDRLDVAYRNGLRLQKLVNMLLDFSRIEAGRMEPNFRDVDIAALTKGLTSNFRSAIEKAGMNLIIECHDLPGPVVLDPEMWEKIVLNLISNAFKYSTEGTITVRLTCEKNHVILSVQDTGAGIPASEHEKIFERFHRVQNAKGRSTEGTGIGLSMVRELVKLHKGTITVDSEVGHGSKFSVRIPLDGRHSSGNHLYQDNRSQQNGQDVYSEEARQWVEGIRKEADTRRDGKFTYTVLVVDDNSDMRNHVERLLSSDFHVITAADGGEAFQKMLDNRPNLVISDIMMPVMDGFALLARIRENLAVRNTPLIFLSARAGEEARVEGLNAGADDYLVKPFSSRELLAKVNSQIKISETRIRSEQYLRSLLNQAPVAIVIFRGADFVVELANERYLQIVDQDNSFVGKPFFESLPELEGQGIRELLTGVLKNGVAHIGNELPVMLPRKGTLVKTFFNFVYYPLIESHDLVSGVIVVANEVTDLVNARVDAERNAQDLEQKVAKRTGELRHQKEVAEESANKLQLANEILQGKNRELEQFAYISSHDLQEPLRKIRTFTDLLLSNPQDATTGPVYLKKIDSSAARMSLLIRDLLTYSKLSHEQANFTDVNLNEVLQEVKGDLELLIAEKNAWIESSTLPVIRASRLQMQQLFANLIGNSLKFVEGEPVIRITHELVSSTDMVPLPRSGHHRFVKLTFVDNGIGFESSFAEKIFGLFQRLQNRSDYQGTGIGLALCRKIVENHGGLISASSEKGKGASFYVFFPIDP